uniref:Uncharacterized protein n=1 Tax=Anguilla anguilla TaxID=7936 RepID=A0A0E9UEC8_ANGAN
MWNFETRVWKCTLRYYLLNI